MSIRTISVTFLKGLAAVLPAAITVYVLWWLFSGAERLFGAAFRRVLPEDWYVPGAGVAVAIAVVFLIGVLLNARFAQRLLGLVEALLERIPLVKSIYGAARDLMTLVGGRGDGPARRTVVVRWGEGDAEMRLLGFVTRESFDDLPAGIAGTGMVSVYLPMSYQIGGFTVIVPAAAIEDVDLGTEEAMRLVLTACVRSDRNDAAAPPPPADGAADADDRA